MTTAELVNLIIKKFGGNRVTFTRIKRMRSGYSIAHFKLGGNEYHAAYCPQLDRLVVLRANDGSVIDDNYSRWVEGVLNGMVRDEEGNLVKS